MTNVPFPEVVAQVTAPVKVVAPTILPEPPKVGDKNTAPNTTEAEDKTKAGQRMVNLIWETVQAIIALTVVAAALYIAGRIALLVVGERDPTERQLSMAMAAFLLVSNLVSLICGFYFGRTNHQKTGGVGINDAGR